MSIEIGKTIKELRLSNKLTQSEVALLIGYTSDYIKKIESSKCLPSSEVLSKLSKLYNCDLIKFNSILKDFESSTSYNQFLELRQHISDANIVEIEKSYIKVKNLYFFSFGEPLQLVLYAGALLEYVKGNHEKVIEICITGIIVDIPNFKFDNIDNTLFSDTSYSLLLCLSAQYLFLNDINKSKLIMQQTLNNFDNVVFNKTLKLHPHSFYIKKTYIAFINNYADINFKLNDYNLSLQLCEQGIDLCRKYETTYTLDYLYELRAQNLYKLDKINEATQSYAIFQSLCIIKQKHAYLNKSINNFNLHFPLIKTAFNDLNV